MFRALFHGRICSTVALVCAMVSLAASVAVSRAAGSWTWWGYRFDQYQTYAIGAQPTVELKLLFSFPLGTASQALALYYKASANWAQWQGKCLGVTWAGGATAVGCPEGTEPTLPRGRLKRGL